MDKFLKRKVNNDDDDNNEDVNTKKKSKSIGSNNKDTINRNYREHKQNIKQIPSIPQTVTSRF